MRCRDLEDEVCLQRGAERNERRLVPFDKILAVWLQNPLLFLIELFIALIKKQAFQVLDDMESGVGMFQKFQHRRRVVHDSLPQIRIEKAFVVIIHFQPCFPAFLPDKKKELSSL